MKRIAFLLALVAMIAPAVFAQATLNVYTIMPEKYATKVFAAFTA
jgi:hypothetical protein